MPTVPVFDPAGTFVSMDYFLQRLAEILEESKAYTDQAGTAGYSEDIIRDTPLTGLNTALSGVVMATDTILRAIGKLENRVRSNENNGIYWGAFTNPNGNVTAIAPAVYYPTDASSYWVKTGIGASNTGWVAMVGGPATG